MTHIITVAQQKGGAGKTTLAVNLAAWFARSMRVALFDIDPQHSAARWMQLRQGKPNLPTITFSDVAGWRLAGELDRLRAAHDLIIIDSPPHVETDARLAVRAASLILVPVQPSAPDVWAADSTLALAKAEKRPVRMVLNRVPPTNTKLTDEIRKMIKTQGTATLAATLANRTGFAQAFLNGMAAHEAAPRSLAAAELQAVAEEVWGVIK
jgi:chromosome partitioning protein